MLFSQNLFLKVFSAAFFIILLLASAARAEDKKPFAAVVEDDTSSGASLWEHETLTGDWGGRRSRLSDQGLDLGASLVLDAQGNPSGGFNQGGVIMGRFAVELGVDFEKIFGANAKGLTGFINAFSIQGRGLTANNVGSLAPTSNIEAQRASFRLFTVWLEQSLWNGDASLRFGQLAADDEFALSEYGGLFVNGTFGWPVALASDMLGGGPAYPYAAPGIRFRYGQNKPWSVQAAVFSGDPTGAGSRPGTPQDRDPSGTSFRLEDGALFMVEGAYTINGEENATGLPGTYKLGVWAHTGHFGDLREDNTGLSLADPGSTGIADRREGNFGLYGVADQMVWHPDGDRERGLGLFLRGFIQPQQDRNLVAWQFDTGLNLKGMLLGRKNDTLGLAFTYAKISDRQREFDRDAIVLGPGDGPVSDFESVIELTYRAQIAPWLTVQPDFQYVFHPGGNVADPNDPTGLSRIEDAAIIALRTVVKF